MFFICKFNGLYFIIFFFDGLLILPLVSSILASTPHGTMSFKICFLSALLLSFREFPMTYMTSKNERNLSVFFCWSLGPEQGNVLRQGGTDSSLVRISHLSKSFNDFRIFSIPKNFSSWAHLNQFRPFLSTNISIP